LILFDIDDTLLNHTASAEEAVAVLHHKLKIRAAPDDFPKTWTTCSAGRYSRFHSEGVPYREIRRARVREAIDSDLSDEAADAIFAAYFKSYEARWALFEDVRASIHQLRGHRLGIVSNGPSHEQRRKLVRMGIQDSFDGVFISEECGSAKPSPQIFLKACSVLGESPSSAMYVGDKYDVDALGARSAGLNGVWLDRTGAAGLSHVGPIVRNLSEVVPMASRVRAATALASVRSLAGKIG
jgi:putative hydrolase of the HAD superfamily